MFSFHGKNYRSPLGEIRPIRPIGQIEGGTHDKKCIYLYERPDGSIDKAAGYFDRLQLEAGDGCIKWLPDIRDSQTTSAVICAVRGAGKSSKAAEMVETTCKLLDIPEGRVFLIKKTADADPAFDRLGDFQLILANETLVDDPMTIDDFASPDGSPSCVIIDDVDVIPSARVRKAVTALQDSLMVEARKRGVYVFVCCHKLARGAESKYLMSEASDVLWSPRAQTSDTSYALERYTDLSRAFITDLKRNQKTRFISLAPHAPRYLLCDDMVMIYDSDREAARVGTDRARAKAAIKDKVRAGIAEGAAAAPAPLPRAAARALPREHSRVPSLSAGVMLRDNVADEYSDDYSEDEPPPRSPARRGAAARYSK